MSNHEPQLTIYQTFHKDFARNAQCSWIQPVGVNGYTAPGVQSDAEGDNIASLNPYYCELTAQYWAWKHSTAPVVGFCHYRRYLNFLVDATWEYHTTVGIPNAPGILAYLTADVQRMRLQAMLGVADAVVARRSGTTKSIQDQYLTHHPRETWLAFIEEISANHPECRPYLNLYALSTAFSACNVYVMRREHFLAYNAELFPLIDKVFQTIGTPYDSYNNRYPGFLAERFLGLWLHAHRLRTFEVPMVQLT